MPPPSIFARSDHAAGIYTAAQLADALKITKRNVLRALMGIIDPAGCLLVNGNETPAWSFDILPERLRTSIASQARQASLSIADYLDSVSKSWQPGLPLAQIAETSLAEAEQLRQALLPALQRQNAHTLFPADHVRLGLEDYQRAFGYSVTERHWRRLMDRTIRRAGNDGQFDRLELYLPDNPTPKAEPQTGKGRGKFARLMDEIALFKDQNAPSENERAGFWNTTFAVYWDNAETKAERKAFRRVLVAWLREHAPWLAKTERGLRVAFDRKFAVWQTAPGKIAPLVDGRHRKRGEQRAAPIPQDDLDKIIWTAAHDCGGRISQAVRQLASSGERSGLSAATLELICRPAASKSYVPQRLREVLRPEVEMIRPYLLGKKAIDDATAHITRDYSNLVSMQVVNADDFTFPVYFYVPDGQGWYTLTRGQCLIMLDSRSLKVIAWSLQPERNNNSLVIRSLMNRVCTEFGLPEKWYFERGIWERSNVVKSPAGWQTGLIGNDFVSGWQQIGVEFVHAHRARSKPVERVGGALQCLMEGLRGYCGRDERRDCPEVTKRAMEDVRAKRVHPGELFFSFDEWEQQLAQVITQYNGASQDGEVLKGLSPEEAFETYWPQNNPPTRMDATCWHLVAHYVKQTRVTVNGLAFRVGSKRFIYHNERTGQDRGQDVLAWFDPECPEFICVTDLEKKNAYLVERSQAVDYMAGKGNEQLEDSLKLAQSHSQYPKARFNVLKSKFAANFRRNLVDVETAKTAAQMADLRATVKTEQKQRAKASKAYNRLGMVMPDNRHLQADAPDRAARLAELLTATETEPAPARRLNSAEKPV